MPRAAPPIRRASTGERRSIHDASPGAVVKNERARSRMCSGPVRGSSSGARAGLTAGDRVPGMCGCLGPVQREHLRVGFEPSAEVEAKRKLLAKALGVLGCERALARLIENRGSRTGAPGGIPASEADGLMSRDAPPAPGARARECEASPDRGHLRRPRAARRDARLPSVPGLRDDAFESGPAARSLMTVTTWAAIRSRCAPIEAITRSSAR